MYSLSVTLVSIVNMYTVQGVSYQAHRLESLCGSAGEKQTIDLNLQPYIFTFNSTNKSFLKCHLELRLHSDLYGFSVFTEVLDLERSGDCGRDFLQFGREFLIFTSRKSAKMCQKMDHTERILRQDGSLYDIDYKGVPHEKREYLETVKREMDIWLAINPPKPGEGNKKVQLVVTPVKKKCPVDDRYYRQCPGTDRCIKRELFCDGIINCDGAPKDEQEEYCLIKSSSGTNDIFLSIPIIIIIVVFSIVGLMFLIFLGKLITLAFKRKTANLVQSNCQSETQALRDPISTTFCETSNTRGGLRALHSQLSGSSTISASLPPSAPSVSESDVEILTLPPHPPPYSEAVGTIYKDDPPKYTELPEEAHEVLFKR